MESVDVGSLPFQGDVEALERGAEGGVEQAYFERVVVDYFVKKLRSGLDVATYPQLRDMCYMFLKELVGLINVDGKYAVIEAIKPKRKSIPEVDAVFKYSKEIYEEVGKPFSMRICVTGPYTLASFIIEPYPEQIVSLADALSQIADGSLQQSRYGNVEMLCVEEPLLGVIDDPRLDYAGEWSEALLKAWDRIFYTASTRGVVCAMHLHSTSNRIFWDLGRLDVIEAEADDYIFRSEKTRSLLERYDKRLKASICSTNLSKLAEKAAERIPRYSGLAKEQKIGQIWADIKCGREDPAVLLESEDEIRSRLKQIVSLVGLENVPYAGPECGLKGFFSLDLALLYLKRCSGVVKGFAEG
jgi:methionine synthase II (cobalamin-independent)